MKPPAGGAAVGRRRASVEDILAMSAHVHEAERSVDALFSTSMEQLRELLNADRATLFLVDAASGQLWSKVAQGTSEIRLPMGRGIAGHVATTGELVNVTGTLLCFRASSAVDWLPVFPTHVCGCVVRVCSSLHPLLCIACFIVCRRVL